MKQKLSDFLFVQILPAKTVYLLMKKDYRISRNIRASWFLEHLNSVMEFNPVQCINDTDEELKLVSVVPATNEETGDDQLPLVQPGMPFMFQLLPSTVVTFLAKRYRLVFVLDLSPSAASVDLKTGEVLLDKISHNLRCSITGLVKPFMLPGTKMKFVPELYVTVIAYTPVLACTANQVLAQGMKVTEDNAESFLSLVLDRLDNFEQSLASGFNKLNNNLTMDEDLAESIGYEEVNAHRRKLNDSLYNLIRQGLFGLQLLPENSSAGIIIVTDAMMGSPDANIFDHIMTQLRNSTVACSFLKIGETYCARCQFGCIPHVELLQFIATATFGAYFAMCPDVSKDSCDQMNIYHKALLLWSFQKGLEGFKYELTHHRHVEPMHPVALSNRILSHPIKDKNSVVLPTVRQKHMDAKLSANILSVLSVRLREGYTIKDVYLNKGGSQIEVHLILPYKDYVKIEYTATAFWPMETDSPQDSQTYAEVYIEGRYDFLHDFTCSQLKVNQSQRMINIKRFWMTLERLRQDDQLLDHLQTFGSNTVHYKVPDSIKKGIPLFYMPPNSNNPVLNSQHNNKDSALLSFAMYWKPVVNLDIKIWQKWMHSHRIGMILEHDVPLPKYLHTPNSSGRFHVVLCRQALTSLHALLRDWSTFVLLENDSYIKLLPSNSEKPPTSFLLLRVTSKPPYMVLRLAFLGGSPGWERYCTIQELRDKVAVLRFPKRGPTKVEKAKVSPTKDSALKKLKKTPSPLLRDWSEINCCVLLTKPVEQILISYDRLPQDMSIIEDPSKFLPSHLSNQQLASKTAVANTFNMMSRYLHHQRWVWTVKQGKVEVSMPAIGRILSTLAKIRLQEGFNFVSSNSGIVNMVAEVEMQVLDTDVTKCAIQYIMFPPYIKTTRDSVSEEDVDEVETTEADGDVQIVTECWAEPQFGVGVNNPTERKHWDGMTYKDMAKALYPPDLECISCLVTFEHLVYVCQNTVAVPNSVDWLQNGSFSSSVDFVPLYMEDPPGRPGSPPTIHQLPLPFDILSLLSRSQQAELLVSTFRIANPKEDEIQRDIKGSNNLFFNLMFEKLKETTQREVIMSTKDSFRFLHLLKERKRDTTTHPFPFSFEDDLDQLLEDQVEYPQWRCFVRASSNTRMFLTFLPASFDDLLKLNDLEEIVKSKSSSMCEDGFKDGSLGRNAKLKADFLTPVTSLGEKFVSDSDSNTIVDRPEGSEAQISGTDKDVEVDEQTELENLEREDTVTDLPGEMEEESNKENKYLTCVVPMYVYECYLNNVTDSLINPWTFELAADIFEDCTFQTKGESLDTPGGRGHFFRFPSFDRDSTPGSDDKDDYETLHQILRCSQSQERRMTESSVDGTEDLKIHCTFLSEVYSSCFVNGVFQSLQHGYFMAPEDIDSVIYNMCTESFPLETDITTFLLASCRHFRQIVESAQEERNKEQDKGTETTNKRSSVRFMENLDETDGSDSGIKPVPSILQLPTALVKLQTQPASRCEYQDGLHSLIRRKFTDITQKWFQLVPNYPNYYFYCPESVPQDSSLESGETDEKDMDEQVDTGPTIDLVRSVDDGLGITEREDGYQLVYKKNEDADHSSMATTLDSDESFASEVDLCPELADDDVSNNSGPLFVYFTCTVKSRMQYKDVSVQTLIPCLDEILIAEEKEQSTRDPMELQLGDLKITFDLHCLTLQSDSDMQNKPEFQRMLSNSSEADSPPPSSETGASGSVQVNVGQLQDPIAHLPKLQQHAVHKCKEEIEWLLKDEIVSALRHLQPVKTDALQFVTEHVRLSAEMGKPNCATEKIKLSFVYGSGLSLLKFKEEFERLSYLGYRLMKEEDYYYVVRGRTMTNLSHAKALNTALVELSREGTPAKQNNQLKADIFQTNNPDSPEVLTTYVSPLFLTPEDPRRASLEVESPLGGGSSNMSGSDGIKDLETQEGGTIPEGAGKGGKKRQYRSRFPDKMELHFNRDRHVDFPRTPLTPPVKSDKRSMSLGEEIGQVVLKKSSSFAGFLTEDSVESFKRQDSMTALSISPIKGVSGTPQLPSLGRLRHSSAPSGQGTPMSKHSTLPQTPSWISSRGSYTDIGYEGDSSDTDDDNAAYSDLSGRQQPVPKFWLLMQVGEDGVDIYFHARETGKEDNEEKIEQRMLLSYFRSSIENLCRRVNQKMLLNDLYESRTCDPLLVPEADEEVSWNLDKHVNTGHRHLDSSDASEADEEEDQHKVKPYLAATYDLRHEAGYFNCDCVLTHQFIINPRLKMGAAGSKESRGMKALRSVLNKFSVINRKNMFVVKNQHGSQAVFYLKLKEVGALFRQTSTISSEDISLADSASSAMFSSRRDDQGMLVAEKDCDSVSLTSVGSASQRPCQDYVELLVHGIEEAGPDIKVDLISMLQKRLDDAVLEMISLQLSRNPVSKLSPGDVHFIQKPGVDASKTLHLTLPSSVGVHLSALLYYLKQNLLQFCHMPNYADNRLENRFQSLVDNRWQVVEEGNMFIYIRPHALGGRGIACISLSLVNHNGSQVRVLTSPKPSRLGCTKINHPEDFDAYTHTELYTALPSDKLGLTTLVQFCIWECGGMDLATLQEKLTCAVKHALCDIVMEFYVLTASVCPVPVQLQDLLPMPAYSAPSSPITKKEIVLERRHSIASRKLSESLKLTGNIGVKQSEHSPLQSLKDAFSTKARLTSPPPDSQKTFEFGPMSTALGTSPVQTERDSELQSIIRQYEEGERGNLSKMFTSLLKDWMEICYKTGVPAVSKLEVSLLSKYSVDNFLREFQTAVTTVSSDIKSMAFQLVKDSSGQWYGSHPYRPHRQPLQEEGQIETSLDCDRRKLPGGEDGQIMLIGRNVDQWRASIQDFNEEEFSVMTSTSSTAIPKQTFQRFSPLLHTNQDTVGLNEQTFIPRQRLLMLSIHNKQISVYSYNWARDLSTMLSNRVTQIVQWHNTRIRLLDSVISQKMGLYHHSVFRELRGKKEYGPYASLSTDIDHLIKFTAPSSSSHEPVRRHNSLSTSINQPVRSFDESFKDIQPQRPLHQTSFAHYTDPVAMHGLQAQDLRSYNRKEMEKLLKLNKLYWIWFEKTSVNMNMPISDEVIQLLKQSCRLYHYCATPLLFHPLWRQKVMEKYKVTQRPTSVSSNTTEKPEPKARSRHSSGTSVTSMRTKRADSTEGKKRPTINVSHQEHIGEEPWHIDLRASFVNEYMQYVQSLGFVLIQMRPATPKRASRHVKKSSFERVFVEGESIHGPIGTVHYLQKTQAGGIMLMELSFREQYFCVKLFTCEYTRLGVPVNQQLKLLFVEECEKCKDLIHVHSFAHDFHLRCIHSHISRQQVFKQSYHLTGFLSDFMQVYPYPPNFSRNFLHEDTMTVGPLTCPGSQLYEFMLQHVKLHQMKVIAMVPNVDADIDSEYHFVRSNEYALVCHKLRKNEDHKRKQKLDDYNVGLVITHDSQQVNFQNESERTLLKLHYFVVMTSCRELFPKATIDNKEGTKGVFLEELRDRSKPVPVKQHIGVRQETVRTSRTSDVHNTPGYNLLMEEAQLAREKIESMVEVSTEKCRKDLLWQRMLVGEQSEEDGRRKKRSETEESRDVYQKLSFDEFLELLAKVVKTPLGELDPMLMQLESMNFMWYKGLFRVLQTHYPETHRCFFSHDGQTQYILILNPNYLDMFMMLMLDNTEKRTDLCAIFRESITDQEHSPENPNLSVLGMHSHVEDFVNVCCYHLWASMV
ncbi:KICSTOR complex protein SZT2-like [Ylistrum balloti]|uniref:KICSTOR complex protein SZT2-like n=1 Tax=Ylistrum balloti TaxID=509963 RepID=UPI002905B1AD|nr:KICSTOR complex protein SZT2-like [Ylistrum balloti]